MEGYNNHLEKNNRKNCSSNNDVSKQLTPVKRGFHLPLSSNRFNHQTLKMDARFNNSLRHRFHYIPTLRTYNNLLHRQQNNEHNQNINEGAADEAIKAKIMAHPQYSSLLQAYMDCQKVGAPAEVMARLATIRQDFETRPQQASASCGETLKDPELDQFMECYHDMLVKYREELTRPLQEAMEFMQRIERQLQLLSTNPHQIFNSEDRCEGITSSEEDQHKSSTETTLPQIDPRAEDRELKNHLLRKYSGYLSNLKQELSKKKKKGKLPKDARQKLLSWWDLHYKWPYPSETEKVSLAESSGLDHKQINNWFINQRKRHWKPSGNAQYVTTVDGVRPHNAAPYMEDHYGEGAYRFGP